MAAPTLHHRQSRFSTAHHSYRKTTSMILGVFIAFIAVICSVFPGFLGLTLSVSDFVALFTVGSLCVWRGTTDDERTAHRLDVGLGLFFLVHALCGIFLKGPDSPQTGIVPIDNFLFRYVATDLPEIHFFISLFFLSALWSWVKEHRKVTDNSLRV